jgi:hypothetical protein
LIPAFVICSIGVSAPNVKPLSARTCRAGVGDEGVLAVLGYALG